MMQTQPSEYEMPQEEFRLTLEEARGEHLIVMGLGCFVLAIFPLVFFGSWWGVLLMGPLFALYFMELQRRQSVMDIYTDEMLNLPRVLVKNVMGLMSLPYSARLPERHKSERMRLLVRQIHARLGTQHPLYQELWQHGPYSITHKFQFLASPEDRIYVADRLRELCQILNWKALGERVAVKATEA